MRAPTPLLAALLCAACAGAASEQGSVDRGTQVVTTSSHTMIEFGETTTQMRDRVAGSVAQAWSALDSAYADAGIAGGIIDAGRYRYGNPHVTVTRLGEKPVSAYFRCGNEGTGPSSIARYRIEFGVVTQLSRQGETTELSTEVTAVGAPLDGTSRGRVLCTSTGELERRIALALQRRLLRR